MNRELFDKVSYKTSKVTTQSYSTSFSLGIKFLNRRFHNPIYAIYGFVRLADEIVDTFHEHDKHKLLEELREDTYRSVDEKISLNPVLNSFQEVVRKFNIDRELIDTFLESMEMDLEKKVYDESNYKKYILGSAEVVGLMCLKVFVEGDQKLYEKLKPSAMSLGSAFQKINFLRDLHADFDELGRSYFPDVDLNEFNEHVKKEIEKDIEADFRHGYEGITQLPKSARFGVYLAYVYYISLFNKIKRTNPKTILTKRVRIPNLRKYSLLFSSYLRHSVNLL